MPDKPSYDQVRQALDELGINTPYHLRVVGNRMEFHTPYDVKVWQPQTRAELLKLAGKKGIKGRSRMTKAELLEAIEGAG